MPNRSTLPSTVNSGSMMTTIRLMFASTPSHLSVTLSTTSGTMLFSPGYDNCAHCTMITPVSTLVAPDTTRNPLFASVGMGPVKVVAIPVLLHPLPPLTGPGRTLPVSRGPTTGSTRYPTVKREMVMVVEEVRYLYTNKEVGETLVHPLSLNQTKR